MTGAEFLSRRVYLWLYPSLERWRCGKEACFRREKISRLLSWIFLFIEREDRSIRKSDFNWSKNMCSGPTVLGVLRTTKKESWINLRLFYLYSSFDTNLSRKVFPSLKGSGIGNCGSRCDFYLLTYYFCHFSHCHAYAVDNGPLCQGLTTHVTALCSHILWIRIKYLDGEGCRCPHSPWYSSRTLLSPIEFTDCKTYHQWSRVAFVQTINHKCLFLLNACNCT